MSRFGQIRLTYWQESTARQVGSIFSPTARGIIVASHMMVIQSLGVRRVLIEL